MDVLDKRGERAEVGGWRTGSKEAKRRMRIKE